MGTLYGSLYSYIVEKYTSKEEMVDDVQSLFMITKSVGKVYANRLMPYPARRRHSSAQIKTGNIKPFVEMLDPSIDVIRIVERAQQLGEGPPTNKLDAHYKDYAKAKAVARTAMLNYYTFTYLNEWHDHGLHLVKRIEMHDHKTCPICRTLNGNIYNIEEVLREQMPLTFLSHPNCRGSYSPYMAVMSKVVPVRPVFRDITVGGNKAAGVPPEYVPWVRHVLLRDSFDFNIQCVIDRSKPLTEVVDNTLIINIYTIGQRDIRELILAEKAKRLFPKWETLFMKEYFPQLKTGLVHPQRSWSTPRDVFIDGYVSLILRQLDEPFEIYWWSSNFMDIYHKIDFQSVLD